MSAQYEYKVGTVGAENKQPPLLACGNFRQCRVCPVSQGGVFKFVVPEYYGPITKHPNFPHEGNMYGSSVAWPMNTQPIIDGLNDIGLTVVWTSSQNVLAQFGYGEPVETLCAAGHTVMVERQSVRKVE